ncbi:multidrug resistance protein 1 (ATP-binding cassettesub-family B member 1) (P-glycoprotein 1) (antigen) [Streptococcus pneumoniae]|nr:multidrug resistance protein 1 (ATP-binding cassettesub-family B member 1) (P-glycoprotein 1) (antigen) [Streptococcus pneumoniae]
MKIYPQAQTPRKSSKLKPLIAEDKAYNHALSKDRSKVENILAKVKTFKMFSTTYRNHRKRFGLRMNLSAGIINHELGFYFAGSLLSKIPSGLYKIDTGKVLFDGVNINQIDKKILSQNLGVVPQDSFLLNRSILDNITLKHEVTSQKIEEVCKAVQIYDEIMAMPMKFNTIISEMGSNISGGQRQRIALARALINNPSIVILDEATSALDTINEERITKYIKSQGCTQIIVAHRLSTIKDADIIVVMKGGKIVESGNHKYLMDLGGEYYSLYTKRK